MILLKSLNELAIRSQFRSQMSFLIVFRFIPKVYERFHGEKKHKEIRHFHERKQKSNQVSRWMKKTYCIRTDFSVLICLFCLCGHFSCDSFYICFASIRFVVISLPIRCVRSGNVLRDFSELIFIWPIHVKRRPLYARNAHKRTPSPLCDSNIHQFNK